jgi:hypothetical protein
MKKHLRLGVALLVAAALLTALGLVYDQTQAIGWIGGYPVEVRIERTGGRPVRAASAALLFRQEWDWARSDPARIDSPWKPVPVGDGDLFTVEVKHFGKDSGLGRQLSYGREEVLVLKVDYADGEVQLVTADLPGYRERRRLVLQVP